MDANQQATTAKVGRVVLFLGTETVSWSFDQFVQAAHWARSHGVDSIAVKCADGPTVWYDAQGGVEVLARRVRAEAGCGFVPYAYCYGWANSNLPGELAALRRLMAVGDGCVCADLEAEFNGQVDWATTFCDYMRGVPGLLYLTSWADPDQQNWDGVTQALAPCVNAWVPQQYNTWLAHQEAQLTRLGETCIQPAIDLSQEFGTNDPAGIARDAVAHGHTTVWLWELGFAQAQPQLVDSIVSVMAGAASASPTPPPPPPVNPDPDPTPDAQDAPSLPASFTVTHWAEPGSSLTSIAQLMYGDASRWRDIYNANVAVIGQNPDVIRAGEVLRIPRP